MSNPAPANGVPAVRYDPPQNELKYYNELFNLADQANSGEINGHTAVTFLSRSKLPVDLLKNIWSMADYPKTNSLNSSKFFTAVRLIQLFQNGKKATGPGLSTDDNASMRPPFFDGVTGVSVMPFDGSRSIPISASSPPQSPIPQRRDSQISANSASGPGQGQGQGMNQNLGQNQGYISSPPAPHSPTSSQAPPVPALAPGQGYTNGHSTALSTQDPYLMLPGEQVRYESLFPQYAQQDNFVYGAQAVELFTKSGLSKEALRDIWNLVDNPVDNRLDRLEFGMAMHLIVCVSKKNLPIPPVLPASLRALKTPPMPGQGQGQMQGQGQEPTGGVGQIPSPPRQGPGQGPGAPPQRQSFNQGPPPALRQSFSGDGPMQSQQQGIQKTFSGGQNNGFPGIQNSFSGGSVGANEYGNNNHANALSGSATAPGQYGSSGMSAGGGSGGGSRGASTISDAFEGMQQGQGAQTQQQQQQPPVLRPPNANGPVPNSHAELEKVRSVLQKLQAENISLKAQLGQFSEEEQSVRGEIGRTVNEIGILSQELTSLRSQVVDAKSNLIEASAELKAQVEKRDLLKALIIETHTMKEALDIGVKMESKCK
jgi:hypothetical protein